MAMIAVEYHDTMKFGSEYAGLFTMGIASNTITATAMTTGSQRLEPSAGRRR